MLSPFRYCDGTQQELHTGGRVANSASSVKAVIYFNDKEEITVLAYRGCMEPFRTSPYAEQMDACIIFLNEAHTRGANLHLPDTYRAAVTLGANLTKDRVVQGESLAAICLSMSILRIVPAGMRMRKLGKGQSVLFCVPEEIQIRIRECCRQSGHRTSQLQGGCDSDDITVLDVLLWSINETHQDLRKSMPLWASQGQRYERHRIVWKRVYAG